MTTTPRTDDTGSVSLELAVLAPALLAVMLLILGAGRIALAGQAVQQAADQAARATSMARNPTAGVTAGQQTAARVLTGQGLTCNPSVAVHAAALGGAAGQAGKVTVDVACTVPLGDLTIPGLPGTKTLHATTSMPVDVFVERR